MDDLKDGKTEGFGGHVGAVHRVMECATKGPAQPPGLLLVNGGGLLVALTGPRCLMNRETQVGIGRYPCQLAARQEDLLTGLKVGKGVGIVREASKPHKLTLGGSKVDLTTSTPQGQDTNSNAELRDAGGWNGDVVGEEQHLDNLLELSMRPRESHPVEGRAGVPIDIQDEINKEQDAQKRGNRTSLGGATLLEELLTED